MKTPGQVAWEGYESNYPEEFRDSWNALGNIHKEKWEKCGNAVIEQCCVSPYK